MRKVFILAMLVVACAKKEPAPDTTTPAPPPPPPPPAALTAADMKGTWNGVSKREGDTTTVAWTAANVTDSTGKLTFTAAKRSVDYAVKYDADSMVATSKPYNDPTLPKGTPKVIVRSVARMKDGKLVGSSTIMLASKPDSVLGKGNWEATKAP